MHPAQFEVLFMHHLLYPSTYYREAVFTPSYRKGDRFWEIIASGKARCHLYHSRIMLAMTNATGKADVKDWARSEERRVLVSAGVNQELFMAKRALELNEQDFDMQRKGQWTPLVKTRKLAVCLGIAGLANVGRWVELRARYRDVMVCFWRALNSSLTALVIPHGQKNHTMVLIKGVTTLELQFWKTTVAKGEREIGGSKTGGREARRMAVGIDSTQLHVLSCYALPSDWPWMPTLHRGLPGGPLVPACPHIALCCPHLAQSPYTVHVQGLAQGI